MRPIPTTLIATAVVILQASVGLAGPKSGAMPSTDLDAIAAKLLNSGHTGIRVVDQNTNKMSAFDREGSEVMLLVDPQSRRILNTSYVNARDE